MPDEPLWPSQTGGGALPVTTRNVTGATALPVASGGGAFIDTLTGNTTYSVPTGPVAGTECSVTVELLQDATGGRTVTWFAGITWAPGVAPTIPAGGGQKFLVNFYSLDGGVTWIGTYSVSQGVLATTVYNPGSASTYAAGTSSGDLDATNLAITFTAPASGKVLVTLNAAYNNQATGGPVLSWSVREGSSDLQTEEMNFSSTASTSQYRGTAIFLITGLTPGTAHTYKWGQICTIASSANTFAGGSQGPAVMKVETA